MYIFKITGSNIKVDIKKLKGADYYRILKGKIRVILKPDIGFRTIFADVVDFRGNVYK